MAAPTKNNTAAGFIGSVVKYSVPTFINVGILGLGIVLTMLFVPPDINGPITQFINFTNALMTIALFGMDQAFIRFYEERPNNLSKNGLFRLCFYFSALALVLGGSALSLFAPGATQVLFGLRGMGPWAVPLLFLNAFFYLILRYFNALYRMEANLLLYGIVIVFTQFFYKLFYLLGMLFQNPLQAMMLCSVGSLGAFSLLFAFVRRKTLRPRLAEFGSGGYRTLLPFGLAIAPAAVLYTLNAPVIGSYLQTVLGKGANGIYSQAFTLSNVVSTIQLGFAAFWGPYMFQNYKTQQKRIMQVHDYLNFAVLVFFALLVAFQDIIFIIFPNYAQAQTIFPLMMLAAVFTVLCETTVYGNTIAKRPIFDTIGIALALGLNFIACLVLVGPFNLAGAAVALSLGNGVMYLFRTFTAQRLYRSIQNPVKTTAAVLLGVALAVAGTLFATRFLPKLLCCAAAIALYCLLYRAQLQTGLGIALRFAKGFLGRKK